MHPSQLETESLLQPSQTDDLGINDIRIYILQYTIEKVIIESIKCTASMPQNIRNVPWGGILRFSLDRDV